MSIFSTIIKDLKSFASKFEAEIAKLWGKAPSFTTIALTTLTFVAPILETVIGIIEPQFAATVTAVINKAETDLLAAKGLLTTIGPTLSVQSLIQGVQSDLNSLLTTAGITDAKAIANTKLVIAELAALIEAFPSTAPASAPGVAA